MPTARLIYYLDSSALSDLAVETRECASKVLALLSSTKARTAVSAINVIELGSYDEKHKRAQLVSTAGFLLLGWRPLDYPVEILRRVALASVLGTPSRVEVTTSDSSILRALTAPDLITEAQRAEFSKTKERLKARWDAAHARVRPLAQEDLKKIPTKERRGDSASRWLRGSFRNLKKLHRFFETLFGHFKLPKNRRRLRALISKSEAWRFYGAALALSIYGRSVRATGFSRKKNPNWYDSEQAIYLACCDVFVTSDPAQRRMLRLVERLGLRRRRVISYRMLRAGAGC